MERIPEADLEARRLYRIRSRNLVIGVWNPNAHGFIGVREKFGSEYPFTEYHWDYSQHLGTVSQMEPTEFFLPDEIPLREGRSECQHCREPAEWVRDPEWVRDVSTGPMGTTHHVDRSLDENHEAKSAYYQTPGLLEWLKPHHDAELKRGYPDEE